MALLHHDDRVEDRTVAADRANWADADLSDERYAGDRYTTETREPVVVRKNSFGHTLQTILATLIVAAVAVFALLNTRHLDIDFGFDTMRMSLSLALGASALAGLVAGWLFGYRRCTRVHTDGL